MSKEYDKLIRDRIPEIIEAEGKRCEVEVLDDEEFTIYLEKKLKEEVDEFIESGKIVELADIYEVILKILELEGVTIEEFEDMRKEKASERGKFEKQLKLKKVDEDDSS